MGTLKITKVTNETAQQAGRNYNQFGDTFKLEFGNYDGIFGNYWATLQYKVGDMTGYEVVETTRPIDKIQKLSWVRWTVPLNLMNHVTTAESAKITLKLITYETEDGTIIGGSVTKSITLNIPEYFKPAMNSLSVQMRKPFNDNGTNKLLKGVSSLLVSMNASGSYSSTIKNYTARFLNNDTENSRIVSTSLSIATTGFTEAGNYQSEYGYVMDSRGRRSGDFTPSPAIEFEVLDYTQPTLSQVWARRVRYDEDARDYIPDATGGKYIQVNANMSTVDAKFQKTHPVKVTVISADGSGGEHVFYIDDELTTVLSENNDPVEFSLKKGFRVRFEALDKVVEDSSFGLSADYKLISINSTTALINGRDYAAGIAFGMYAQSDGVAEFNPDWDIKKKGAIETDFIVESGSRENSDWQGVKLLNNREDSFETVDGWGVQTFLSGKTEKWKTTTNWKIHELVSGIKIAIGRFSFTGVNFTAYDKDNLSDYCYINNPPFAAAQVFATVDSGLGWVANATYTNGQIQLCFGRANLSSSASLAGSILLIGGI